MRNCSGLWNQLTFFQSRGKPIPINSQILCSLGTKIKCLFWNKHTTKPKEKQFMKRLWYETFKYIYVNKNTFGSHGLGFFVQAFTWNFFYLIHGAQQSNPLPSIQNHSLGLLQDVLPLDFPFSSPSCPTKEPRVKDTAKSVGTLPPSPFPQPE